METTIVKEEVFEEEKCKLCDKDICAFCKNKENKFTRMSDSVTDEGSTPGSIIFLSDGKGHNWDSLEDL